MALLLTVIIVVSDGLMLGRVAAELLKKAFGNLPGAIAGVAVGIAYSWFCFYMIFNNIGGLELQLIIVFAPVALFIILGLIGHFLD